MSFVEKSYELHERSYVDLEKNAKKHEAWFDFSSAGNWRFDRMINPLKSWLDFQTGSNWITLGDGSYGLDSIRLKRLNSDLDILPTDIDVKLLELGKKQGLIGDFLKVNAENIEFPDGAFDFAFVKEAYHHFPRPAIALYEMLRVSKKGVVLVEPNDDFELGVLGHLFRRFKHWIKKLTRRPILHPDTYRFETVGNYVYTVSRREIEKVCLGMQLPAYAYYTLNDHYIEGVEYEPANNSSALFRKLKNKIQQLDRKSKWGLESPTTIVAVLFHNLPTEEENRALREGGFNVVKLPKNPYL